LEITDGMCFNSQNGKILYKREINKKIAKEVIDKFIEYGGKLPDIRIANGENIFAYPTDEVKKYYENNEGVIYKEDTDNLDDIDITKITLTGSHKLIERLNKYIRDNVRGYKTHMGATAFPSNKNNNYRLDFTRKSYKGKCFPGIKRKTRLR
jgi:hypothetical protein